MCVTLIITIRCPGAIAVSDIDSEALPRILVHVYDHARVPSRTMLAAEKEANRILREAGIGVSWLDCSMQSVSMTQPHGCRRLGSTSLLLRIVPSTDRSMNHALGFAVVTMHAVYATVFYDRGTGIADHGVKQQVSRQTNAIKSGPRLGTTSFGRNSSPATKLGSFRKMGHRTEPVRFAKQPQRGNWLCLAARVRFANRTPESHNRTGFRLSICGYVHGISTLPIASPVAAEMQAT
jgi:hypothetical protein